jgi:gamma-glutamylcyclotransferase (GGCT)/AIG2-like uncharacterized protein YtfP
LRFFFYGTLIAGGGNPVAAAAHALLHDRGPATTRGVLHAIEEADGWYPILLAGDDTVHGRLYDAAPGFGARDLAGLDAYEDYDPADPAGSLYRRVALAATDANGAVHQAQVYRYDRLLPGAARPIPHGDFHAWLAHEGLRAFAGLR